MKSHECPFIHVMAGVLAVLSAVLSLAVFADSNRMDSTSISITLHLPPEVVFTSTADPDRGEVCFRRFPNQQYRVSVTDIDMPVAERSYKRMNSEKPCVPVSVSAGTKFIYVVAE